MKKIFLFVLGLVFGQLLLAQEPILNTNLRFVQYLMGRGDTPEALRALDFVPLHNPLTADSVNFYKGWLHYQRKELLSSTSFLLKVSPESDFFLKSRFFAAYNQSYLGDFLASDALLLNLRPLSDSLSVQLAAFQLAGNSLLKRDFIAFEIFSAECNGDLFFLEDKKARLQAHALRLQSYRPKSAPVAALMSAAVPGLGKIYAGKTAEGVASLLYVGSMAGVSYELYRQGGLKSPFFWVAATVTSVFYFGNIWGSYFAAQRSNNLFNYEIDQRILLDLHIPLRNFFN